MERSIGRIVAIVIGAGFLLAGVIGFINHDFLGMHLSTSHNLIHLISGVLALYIGLKGSLTAVRVFNLTFGAVYLLLGVAGFIAGGQAEPTAGSTLISILLNDELRSTKRPFLICLTVSLVVS